MEGIAYAFLIAEEIGIISPGRSHSYIGYTWEGQAAKVSYNLYLLMYLYLELYTLYTGMWEYEVTFIIIIIIIIINHNKICFVNILNLHCTT